MQKTKGLISHGFTFYMCSKNENQISFYPFVPRDISILTELALGYLHYRLTDLEQKQFCLGFRVIFEKEKISTVTAKP